MALELDAYLQNVVQCDVMIVKENNFYYISYKMF